MTLLREVKEIGGRHMAIMAHLGHVRELQTDKVREAIARLRQEAGVIIRSQSPIMRGINDDAEVWANKWREEVRLGIIPYYMFMARDTGAQSFFSVGLAEGSSSLAAAAAPELAAIKDAFVLQNAPDDIRNSRAWTLLRNSYLLLMMVACKSSSQALA